MRKGVKHIVILSYCLILFAEIIRGLRPPFMRLARKNIKRLMLQT